MIHSVPVFWQDPIYEFNPSSSSSLYSWFTRGLVSFPDIVALPGSLVPNYFGNWKKSGIVYQFFKGNWKTLVFSGSKKLMEMNESPQQTPGTSRCWVFLFSETARFESTRFRPHRTGRFTYIYIYLPWLEGSWGGGYSRGWGVIGEP